MENGHAKIILQVSFHFWKMVRLEGTWSLLNSGRERYKEQPLTFRSPPGTHSRSCYSLSRHKLSHRIPTSDKVALRSWKKEIKQGHFIILSKHRQKQVAMPPTKYQTPPYSSRIHDCYFFITYSFIFILVSTPCQLGLLRYTIVEVPLFSDSMQSCVNPCFLRSSCSKSANQNQNPMKGSF